MSRKIKESEARRSYILDAARGLFFSKGVENTSMEDIAKAAEYTRRTLYAYFRSRDEICLLVYLEDLTARWEEQQAAMATAGGGLEKLLAWGKSFYVFSREHPHSLRLQVFWDYRGINRDRIGDEVFGAFRAKNEELADGLRDAFLLGIQDGSLRPDLPVDHCISYYALTLRSALNRALFPAYSFTDFDPETYVHNYLDLFMRGIRSTDGEQQ
jgi:AcrR family transcriptional regulator